jgi:predicted nucleotidyltransferase
MFEELIIKVSSTLDESNMSYMVIGGQAVLLYGEPRLTKDIDITLGAGIADLDNLLSAIKQIPLQILVEDVQSFVKQTMVLPAMHEPTGIRVDFIFSFTPYEAQAIKRAKLVEMRGQRVCFAAVEDLIIHKIFAGRPRDIEDVRKILLKDHKLDIQYTEKWLRELESISDEKIFLATFRNLLK